MNETLDQRKFYRLNVYLLLAAVFWTTVLGASLGLDYYAVNRALTNQLKDRAGVAIEKDMTYRKWNSMHGGVYVPVTSEIKPNTLLDIADRDVTTTDGKLLTLVNPLYMTRLIQELQKESRGVQTHLASLNPKRPENLPDEWEREALHRFSKGETEISSYSNINGRPVFRSMVPFVVEEPCLKCHREQGYKIGEVRGGISATIDPDKSLEGYRSTIVGLFLGHFGVWALGLVFLFVGKSRLARSWEAEIEAVHAAEKSSLELNEFINSALDSLNAHISILDENGKILYVNEGWRRFANDNDGDRETYGLGLNYLEVCEKAQGACSEEAGEVAALIKELINGARSDFVLEYPCHSPSEKRWFEVRGTRFMFRQGLRIAIAHQDVTRLKTSEIRFQSFVELAPVGLWATDETGSNTYVSPNWSAITGISAEDASGAGWADGVHPDDRDEVYRGWKQATTNNEPYQSHFRFVRPDGETVWVLCQSSSIKDHEDNVIEWLGTITDITRLKKVQEELKAGEAELLREVEFKDAINSIFERLLSPTCSLTDIAMTVLEKSRNLTQSKHGYVNETDPITGDQISLTLTRMFGKDCEIKDPGQIRFPKGPDGIYPGLWGHSLNNRLAFYTNDPSSHAASKGIPSGHVPLERFLSVPVIYGNDLVGQIALSNPLRDYNDADLKIIEKIASYYALAIHEKRVQQTQNILNSAILNASEAVIIADSTGRIRHANTAFEQITGFKVKEAIGRTGTFLGVSEDENQNFLKDVSKALNVGSTWHGVVQARRKTGETYYCDCSVIPVFNDAGALSNAVALVRDVTGELRLKEQLVQSQKMEAMGTLAGGIAHDFNNIIFAINASAELALDNVAEGSPIRRFLQNILRSADRASDMVRQILMFSRRDKAEKIPLNIIPIVKDGLKFIRGATQASIEIIRSIDPDTPKICGDPTQVYQVLMNLCTNAAHAMKDRHGSLSVSLGPIELDKVSAASYPPLGPGSYVRLMVSDTGEGIPPEIINRIFEPYFTTKKSGEGTGLGLSVLHGIVQNHGGAIAVHSEPGEGTTFEVLFPVAQDDPGQSETELDEELGGNERILWVDDESIIIDMAQQTLEQMGFTVTTVQFPLDALAIFRNAPESFDLVITDLSMPKMTGLEFAKEISSIRHDIPVILCTGYADTVSGHEATSSGITSIINKPLPRKNLVREIRKVLDGDPHLQ